MKLKRLLAPRFWKIPKKKFKFAVCPIPGPHKKFECIPLLIIVRDILKIVETGKEAKNIIKRGEVLIDGRVVKKHAFPVGLMDTISFPLIGRYYRVLPSKKGLELVEISENDAKMKLCGIKNKTVVKGGRIQLNLHDGRNIIVDKDVYKTGDSVLISLPDQKILRHIPLEKDGAVLITKGKNAGCVAKVKEIVITRSCKPNKVICEIDGKEIEVVKDHILAVGRENL